MSNKKRISLRIGILEKKHFLEKHQVRIFKRHFTGLYFQLPEPIKQLEGMLALERTKSGEIKTVFAGSRDFVGRE